MKFRYLGRSGLLVSRICLGTMTFGNKEWGCGQEGATAIVRRFIEAGGTFIDTADVYSGGRSEEEEEETPDQALSHSGGARGHQSDELTARAGAVSTPASAT